MTTIYDTIARTIPLAPLPQKPYGCYDDSGCEHYIRDYVGMEDQIDGEFRYRQPLLVNKHLEQRMGKGGDLYPLFRGNWNQYEIMLRYRTPSYWVGYSKNPPKNKPGYRKISVLTYHELQGPAWLA